MEGSEEAAALLVDLIIYIHPLKLTWYLDSRYYTIRLLLPLFLVPAAQACHDSVPLNREGVCNGWYDINLPQLHPFPWCASLRSAGKLIDVK